MAGRPKILFTETDWQDIEYLMQCGCSGNSIADKYKVSYDTLSSRIKERYKADFTTISAQKKEVGQDLLKQKAFEYAMGGNTTLLIFLLKCAGFNEKSLADKQDDEQDLRFEGWKELCEKLNKAL